MVAIIFCICIASLLDILSKDSESKNFDMRIGKKRNNRKFAPQCLMLGMNR